MKSHICLNDKHVPTIFEKYSWQMNKRVCTKNMASRADLRKRAHFTRREVDTALSQTQM